MDAHTSNTASNDAAKAYVKHRRLVRLGQAFMAVAALVAVVHLAQHLASSPSGFADLVAGYPAAGVVFIVGAVLAGRAEPRSR